VREAILAEEQECGLHPPDGQDLSVELDKTVHAWIGSTTSTLLRPGDYHS
jgi:hypothetical protein